MSPPCLSKKLTALGENVLSPQELDLVNRSKKKVKRSATGDYVTHDEDATSVEMEANMDKIPQQMMRASFRDTLAKNNPNMAFFSYSNPAGTERMMITAHLTMMSSTQSGTMICDARTFI